MCFVCLNMQLRAVSLLVRSKRLIIVWRGFDSLTAYQSEVKMYDLDLHYLKSTEWGYFLIRNCLYGHIEDLEIRTWKKYSSGLNAGLTTLSEWCGCLHHGISRSRMMPLNKCPLFPRIDNVLQPCNNRGKYLGVDIVLHQKDQRAYWGSTCLIISVISTGIHSTVGCIQWQKNRCMPLKILGSDCTP